MSPKRPSSAIAFALCWTSGLGADPKDAAADGFPPAYFLSKRWNYGPAVVLIGIVAGLALGWGWKRSVTPRIEMYEVPSTPRTARRSASRDLQRYRTS